MAPTWVKGGKSWGDPDQGPLSLPCPLGIMCAVCAGYISHIGLGFVCSGVHDTTMFWVDACVSLKYDFHQTGRWTSLPSSVFVQAGASDQPL